MRETLSRSTTTKSWSEYLVKISTQKFTLGSIDLGCGNGSVVSDDARGGAAIPTAIASVSAATAFAIRFADNFVPNKALSPRTSPQFLTRAVSSSAPAKG